MLQRLGPVRRTDVVQQGREPLLRREVVLEALHEGVVPERGREALAQGLARPAAQPPVSQSASLTAGGALHSRGRGAPVVVRKPQIAPHDVLQQPNLPRACVSAGCVWVVVGAR